MSNDVITLDDPATGAIAKIQVRRGFNCFSFVVMLDGQPVETLWSHPNFEQGGERPSGSGIPILFPFGGRIEGTTFRYEGHDYALQAGDAMGNAIHGFVLDRPWRLIEQSPQRAVGQFESSVDDPSLRARWPAEFRITVSYELCGGRLVSNLRVENPGERPLPFGLATHAYFRLPIGASGRASESVVEAPVTQQWELVDLRPSGKLIEMGDLAQLPSGMQLGDRQFDHAFTGLRSSAGRCITRIRNVANGHALWQSFDDCFRHLVIYTPPHREAICIEPYTALADPFRLEAAGVDAGLRRLAPGQVFETSIEIGVE